ncbi:MAG: biopolymer transporter Tol [Mongoliitalea sp.]
MKQRTLPLFILLFFLAPSMVFAQFDRDRFGKNRVQHKNIEWYLYSSNNFEVYYFDGGMNNARMAIDFLESEFDRLTQMIGYVAYTKPKVFIYNSPEELLQSNLNLNKDEYTIDGQTYFSRLIGEVAFEGTWEKFKKDLLFTTSKIIIEEMLYGSTIVDAFQSNLINSFPDWYIEGAARYIGYGWSRDMDDFVRHYFKENKNIKLHRLQEKEAALVGQSVWNFIVEKYGRRYISSILNLSRINRNEENSIANTIGLNYKSFQEQWRQFYISTSEPVFTSFKDINQSNQINVTKPNVTGAINDIKFSPDAKHLAYVINNGGKYRVQVREISSGRERTIFSGGSSTPDQPANLTSPVIAWRDTLNLTIATFRRGTTTLRSRAIDGSYQDRIFLRNITQVLNLDFNSTGRNMVLSAIANGRTDIYTLNVRGVGRRLTNDVFDNIYPVFLNDSTVIFASNRTDLPDSVLTRTPDVKLLPDYFNLYKVDLNDTTNQMQRLTNQNNINSKPKVLNSNNILVLSDQSGIMNLNRLTISNGIMSQVSAFNKSIEAFDYSSRINRIAYAVRDGNQSKLILESFSNADQFTPSTPRVQLLQAKNLSERISNRRTEMDTEERAQVEEKRPAFERNVRPSTVKPDSTLNVRLEDIMSGRVASQGERVVVTTPTDTIPPVVSDSLPIPQNLTGSINVDRLRFERSGAIDTDNYIFDTIPSAASLLEASKNQVTTARSNLLENFRRQGMQKRVVGPRRMEQQFITSSLNTDWIVDPLRGFGIKLNGEMTDLLDNHAFRGSIMTPLDFRSGSDVSFEYEYLKQRVDARFRYDRRAIQVNQGDLTFQRYVLNKAELGFSYPVSVHARFTAAPFLARTQYFNLNPDSILRGQFPERNRLDVNYVGGTAEFVLDKTQQIGLFAQEGMKGKVGIRHYQGLNLGERSFSNFYLDFRNYQKIHKNIIFASRVFAGSFFGQNPQNYLVGGMNNWLFNQFRTPPANRPEQSPVRNPEGVENSNILFAEFVDLRGFLFDEIRGRNVITFTSELRLPLFSYLSRGNITSNFVKNFQMVAFYDVGSAWNEAAPWERNNDRNTEIIRTPGSPFVITLNNFGNAWLQSYGAGLRTIFLNYYCKLDVARPVRNFETENLRFYVTLGYNF